MEVTSTPIKENQDSFGSNLSPVQGNLSTSYGEEPAQDSQRAHGSQPAEDSQPAQGSPKTRKFTCNVCLKEYTLKWSLKRHLMSHTDKPKCSTCHRFFATDDELASHNAAKHDNQFLCSDCGVSFKRKHDLNQHLTAVHGTGLLKVKNCPFDTCGKRFVKERRYQDHVNKHIGVKAHTCQRCRRSFYSKTYLTEHTKTCSNEVNFTCPTCQKKFCYRAALQAHKKAAHDGIHHCCQQCGRRYKHATSLARHKSSCQ